MRAPWVRGCSRARASWLCRFREPLPSPLPCTAAPGGHVQSQRTLEGVHHRINIWAIHPAIQKSLLCWPPPPPSLAVAVATGLTKPELAEGIPVNPFLAQQGPQLHQVPHLRGPNAHDTVAQEPPEEAGWCCGQKWRLRGPEGLVEFLGQLCELEHSSKPLKPQFNAPHGACPHGLL